MIIFLTIWCLVLTVALVTLFVFFGIVRAHLLNIIKVGQDMTKYMGSTEMKRVKVVLDKDRTNSEGLGGNTIQ